MNTQKYQEVILYLCQQLGGEIRGKKKLAKLLYFVDFDFFEKNGASITGDTYFALPMGPFPTSLDIVTSTMQKQDQLAVGSIEEWSGYAPTETYTANGHFALTHLSEDEKRMIARVAQKYGALSGKQLEDLSHQEAPYVATELQKEIPYELAYYRGTDFGGV